MGNRFKLVLLTFMLSHVPIQAQQLWTLDQCISCAIQNNLDLQQRTVQIHRQEVRLGTSRDAWLPEVSVDIASTLNIARSSSALGLTGEAVSVAGNRNTSLNTEMGVGASMPLFDGFRIKNQICADQFLLEAATADLEAARKDIGIQVATSYLQCLYYRSLAEVQRQQVEVSRQMVERAQILFNEGKRPQADLAEAQAQLASDEYALTDARGKTTLALVELSQLLSMPSADGFDIADIHETSEMPLLSATAIYNNCIHTYPSIIAAQKNILASESNVEIARSALYPQLSLIAGVSTGHSHIFNGDLRPYLPSFGTDLVDNLYEYIGVKLSVPIFNRHQTRNNIRLATMDVQSRKLALDDAKLQLCKEIQTAYTNALVAVEKRKSADKAEEATSISVRYEQARYDAGRGNIFDLHEAQQKHLKARQDALQAKYEYLIRQRILDFYRSN